MNKQLIAYVLAGFYFAGCGNYSQKVFNATPQVFNDIKSVAVLPFENLTPDNNAAAVITELFTNQLQRRGGFTVLEKGEMQQRLAAANLTLPRNMDRTVALQVSKAIGVDAVFIGSVLEYQYLKEIRQGKVMALEPAVGLQSRLIESKQGGVIWASSHSRSSYEMFLSSRESLAKVADVAVQKILESLPAKVEPKKE